MASVLRRLVSAQKRRYEENGFDLDLAYIAPRILATAWPAEGGEVLFRNPLSELARFLSTFHPGSAKVYNLCSERCYTPDKLGAQVTHYGFEDHQTPPLLLVRQFCEDAAAWLAADPTHVVAVHCKAGKGRTGIMICCLLLHLRLTDPDAANFDLAAAGDRLAGRAAGAAAARSGAGAAGIGALHASAAPAPAASSVEAPLAVLHTLQQLRVDLCALGGGLSDDGGRATAGASGDVCEDVLALYAARRTHDGKGVTIASQRRYVRYFWSVLEQRRALPLPAVPLRLLRLRVVGLPDGAAGGCSVVVGFRPTGSMAAAPSVVHGFLQAGMGGSSGAAGCVCGTQPVVAESEPGAQRVSAKAGGRQLSVRLACTGCSACRSAGAGAAAVEGAATGCSACAGGLPGLLVEGDVRIQVFKAGRCLFYCWLNTALLAGSGSTGSYSLTRSQLDKVSSSLGPQLTLTLEYEPAGAELGGHNTSAGDVAVHVADAAAPSAVRAAAAGTSPRGALACSGGGGSGRSAHASSGGQAGAAKGTQGAGSWWAATSARGGPTSGKHAAGAPVATELAVRSASRQRAPDPPSPPASGDASDDDEPPAAAVPPAQLATRLRWLQLGQQRVQREPPCSRHTWHDAELARNAEESDEEDDWASLLQALPLGQPPAISTARQQRGVLRNAMSAPATPQRGRAASRRVSAGAYGGSAEHSRSTGSSHVDGSGSERLDEPYLGGGSPQPVRQLQQVGKGTAQGAAPAILAGDGAGAAGMPAARSSSLNGLVHWKVRSATGGSSGLGLPSGGVGAAGSTAAAPPTRSEPEWQQLDDAWQRQWWV